jgi:hypothetical protein
MSFLRLAETLLPALAVLLTASIAAHTQEADSTVNERADAAEAAPHERQWKPFD